MRGTWCTLGCAIALFGAGPVKADEAGVRHEVSLGVAGAGYVITAPEAYYAGRPGLEGQRGGSYRATLDYQLMLRPLEDDGMPLALQPFLQRTPTLRLSASVRGFRTHVPGAYAKSNDFTYLGDGGGLSVSAGLYPHENVRLAFGVWFGCDTTGFDGIDRVGDVYCAVSPWLEGGLRLDKLELVLQYVFQAQWISGTLQKRAPGNFTVVGNGLIGKGLWLGGSLGYLAAADTGYLHMDANIELFVRPTLGVYCHATLQYPVASEVSVVPTSSITSAVGVGWWITPRIELEPWIRFDRIRGTATQYDGWLGVLLHLRGR